MGELVRNFEFLKEKGFKIAEYGFAETVSVAIQTANKIGYPVVLKIPSQIHKTEVGGVLTDVHDVPDLKLLSKEMVSNLESKNIPFDGLIVQKQVKGIELIVGLKEDSVFGKVILLGSGGTLAELTKDVSFRVCPINENDAEEMINETKAKILLSGFRGKSIETRQLKQLLVKVSQLDDVKEMDINPLIVNNEGCWVVDARIIRE
jgi:succinyl-CoA synthetase beta subunit